MYLEEQLTILVDKISDLKKSLDSSPPPVFENKTYINKTNINDELLTTSEVAKLLKSNKNYVGDLIKSGLLPYLKIGSRRVRRSTFNEFLQKYEGWDISDPYNPKPIIEVDK